MQKPLLLLAAVCFVLLRSSSDVRAADFCVADPTLPRTPAGFSCKAESAATVDDFVFSFGSRPGNTSNRLGLAATAGFSPAYAGVNGLGISALRADIAPGGGIPLHTHPAASEILIVVRGTLLAGFVSSNGNRVYRKTVREGESILFPRGLLHFSVNVGKTTATVYSSFNSDQPGLQFTSFALFQNDFPSELVQRVTFIDVEVVKQLKALLGGTG